MIRKVVVRNLVVAGGLVFLLLSSGCSTRLIDFTIISSKNVDLSNASEFTRGTERMEGKDKAHMVLFIPFGVPSMKEAVDRAIETVPGAVALVDGVVVYKWWTAGLYGQSSYIVEGTPLIDPTIASADLPTDYMIAYYDPKIDKTTLIYTSAEDYEAVKAAADRGDSEFIEEVFNHAGS